MGIKTGAEWKEEWARIDERSDKISKWQDAKDELDRMEAVGCYMDEEIAEQAELVQVLFSKINLSIHSN